MEAEGNALALRGIEDAPGPEEAAGLPLRFKEPEEEPEKQLRVDIAGDDYTVQTPVSGADTSEAVLGEELLVPFPEQTANFCGEAQVLEVLVPHAPLCAEQTGWSQSTEQFVNHGGPVRRGGREVSCPTDSGINY